MDLGVRGRARWATVLGIVAALALIGASLVALNRSALSFDGWSSEPQQGAVEQTLPPEPDIAIGTRAIGGGALALPGVSGTAGTPLVPVLPTIGGGTGPAGGAAGGTAGGTGGTGGAPGAGGKGATGAGGGGGTGN